MILVLLLTGCGVENSELNRGMDLRSRLLQAETVSFDTDITADYGDKIHKFSMHCTSDKKGDLTFQVTAPDTLAGISGMIKNGNGALTFDSTALHFELLTDNQLSPISAPWVLIKTLRSGYLTSAGMDGEQLRLTINDSYEKNALQLDIWLGEGDIPESAEVLYDGRNILSMTISAFQIL